MVTIRIRRMAMNWQSMTEFSALPASIGLCTFFEKHNKQNFTRPASSSTTEFISVEQRFCTTLLAFCRLVQKPVPTEINSAAKHFRAAARLVSGTAALWETWNTNKRSLYKNLFSEMFRYLCPLGGAEPKRRGGIGDDDPESTTQM